MRYAIFNRKHDCEIWVTLKVGDRESIDTIKELIAYELDDHPDFDRGYVESYPFFQADWEITGGKLPVDFDCNQVLELTD